MLTVFTRKNFIFLALVAFFSFIMVYVGCCIDAAHTVFSAKNLINMIALGMNMKPVEANLGGFICLGLVAIYTFVFFAAVIFTRRSLLVSGKKMQIWKRILIYAGILLGCILLSWGLGLVILKPLDGDNVVKVMTFVGQSIALSILVWLVLFAVVGSVMMLIVNVVRIGKPFKFFNKEKTPVFDDEDVRNVDVQGSFGTDDANATSNASAGAGAKVGGGAAVAADGAAGSCEGGGNGGGGDVIARSLALDDREVVFPELSKIDAKYNAFDAKPMVSDDISLEQLCVQFRQYLCKTHKLYFDLDTIRYFISGFASSHFEILEGLSGTGKSSLPRYFAQFVNGKVLFMPVQATWRDKSNILGFFNEFSKVYSETEFLTQLYDSNYNGDEINIYVLDELNISRVEYYFADLLSVLEYPVEDWKIKIMNFPSDFLPPLKLEEGYIRIPENSYFVGTANKDDSTFTITDKVYDRAITIDFDTYNTPFDVKEDVKPVNLSGSRLRGLYQEALEKTENHLDDRDMDKINKLLDFVFNTFGLAVGNRILNQIKTIVPVFVACGGTKYDAVDLLLSRKLFAKLEGRFEEYVKPALIDTLALLDKLFGKDTMKACQKTINKIVRALA